MTGVRRREQREIRSGYWLMAAITLAGVATVLAGDVMVRALAAGLALAAGWVLYVLRSRSRQRITGEALTDPLTGLYNRRYLEDRLREELARVERYGGCFTVALIDIDDFKAYNDRFGHAHGDQVLCAVAARLRDGLRRSDLAFRYGGEEFLVLFPDTPTRIAHAALGRVADRTPGVTFSGGLAECPGEGSDAGSLIDLADARLRRAKDGGKNHLRSHG